MTAIPEIQPQHYETRATAINAIESHVWTGGPSSEFAVTFAIDATGYDILRSRSVEQEVLDHLDEPTAR